MAKKQKGELAHLARALAWQARGDRFESGILHLNLNFSSWDFFSNTYTLNGVSVRRHGR